MPSTFEGLSGVALRLDNQDDAFNRFFAKRNRLAHDVFEMMNTRTGDRDSYDEAFDALAGWA